MKIVYVAKLDSMAQEKIKLGPQTPFGRCARLWRHGSVIATFMASPAQVRKAQRQSGKVQVTSKAIQLAVGRCSGANVFDGASRKRR